MILSRLALSPPWPQTSPQNQPRSCLSHTILPPPHRYPPPHLTSLPKQIIRRVSACKNEMKNKKKWPTSSLHSHGKSQHLNRLEEIGTFKNHNADKYHSLNDMEATYFNLIDLYILNYSSDTILNSWPYLTLISSFSFHTFLSFSLVRLMILRLPYWNRSRSFTYLNKIAFFLIFCNFRLFILVIKVTCLCAFISFKLNGPENFKIIFAADVIVPQGIKYFGIKISVRTQWLLENLHTRRFRRL